MRRLTVPIPDEDIRSLHVGDTVFLNGVIVTGRDAAGAPSVATILRYALDSRPPLSSRRSHSFSGT